MALAINVTPGDYAAGVPGSDDRCALALAAQRQWGGEWSFTGRGASCRNGGTVTDYKHTAGSRAALVAFDTRVPYMPGQVHLVPTRYSAPQRRGARHAAIGGVLFLALAVMLGVPWLLAVLAAVLAGGGRMAWALAQRRAGGDAAPGPSQFAQMRAAQAAPQRQPLMEAASPVPQRQPAVRRPMTVAASREAVRVAVTATGLPVQVVPGAPSKPAAWPQAEVPNRAIPATQTGSPAQSS